MNQSNTKKLAIAGILCAVAVVGSLFTFPVLASKCAPIQHMVNVLCAVLLGPWYGVGVAFGASLIRNLLGLGTIMAFPGSMCGALLCGLVFWKTRNLPATLVGEVFGTGIIGGLAAYPVAILFTGADAATVAFYAYIVPFLISTVAGAILAASWLPPWGGPGPCPPCGPPWSAESPLLFPARRAGRVFCFFASSGV